MVDDRIDGCGIANAGMQLQENPIVCMYCACARMTTIAGRGGAEDPANTLIGRANISQH